MSCVICSLSGNIYVVVIMVILCIVLSCLSGIAVGFIVKKLDNIVKLYTQATVEL